MKCNDLIYKICYDFNINNRIIYITRREKRKESGDQMKKYFSKLGILILIILIALTGCKKKTNDVTSPVVNPTDNNKEAANNEDKEKVMKEFENLLKDKDLDKVIDYIDNNIEKLSSIEADKMIMGLENLLESTREKLAYENFDLTQEEYIELTQLLGNELFFSKSKISEISNEKLRERVENLYNNYFKLINIEGDFEPIVDYEALKKYDKYVSDEIKDYIKIKARNSEEPMAVDGALRISYDELSKRILEAEEYVKRYYEGSRYEEVLGLYRTWLGLYLDGLPNTSIADFQSKIIKKDVYESYKKTAKAKDSATAYVVNKYLELIDKNKGIIDDTIKEAVVSLVSEAISLLETSK